MTVTQALMGCGGFSGRLKPKARLSVARLVGYFDTISITPAPLLPLSGFSDAQILASAVFTAVIVDKPDVREFVGYDVVPFFLETPEARGDLISSPLVLASSTSLSTWVTNLRPASIAAGTVTNTTNVGWTFHLVGRRTALDAICKAVAAEWRGNPNLTLDAGPIATLYPTVTTPTQMITRHPEGVEGVLRGHEGGMRSSKDVKDYATQLHIAGPGEGSAIPVSSSSVATPVYKDPLGNDIVMEELVDGAAEYASVALASYLLAQRNQIRRHLDVSSRTYLLPRFARPGDYVWAYDLEAEMTDTANQIIWRGEVTAPIKVRIYRTTWPVPKGCGVYARSMATGSAVWTDLTDDWEFEEGDTIWEVGTTPRPPE